MTLSVESITFDTTDPEKSAQWWAQAAGGQLTPYVPGEYVAVERQPGPKLLFQKVSDPTPGKNRVHVDFATNSAAHQAELVTRLTDLGATPADIGQGDVPWTVMADPEGNEFCVLDSLYQDTGPIASVVVDCADPRAMARFWGRAMDWTLHKVTDHNAVLRSAKGVGPYLQFLRTPDVKTVWNRVHLDLRPYPGDDPEAEASRLRTLGATAIDLDQDVPWMVFADPEGNEFCLLAPR
jgi:predicted enzyme related to lactoylglutathione lyase